MTKEEKEMLKNKMIDMISNTEREIVQLSESTQPISPENSIGRISRMDAINNKSVSEAALRNKKRKLQLLKLSLGKIDLEEFGVCTRCKKPIAQARLLYMPESSMCVFCADK